jgi:hypothetical protein
MIVLILLRQEIMADWRKLRIEGLHRFYHLFIIVSVPKIKKGTLDRTDSTQFSLGKT